jgi:hydrogenase maturation protein HypF
MVTSAAKAVQVLIRGVVQGVGFRPFVHNLASSLGLTGYVLNSSQGVVIQVESRDPERLELFVRRLPREIPPLARIESLEVSSVPPPGLDDFHIRESVDQPGQYVLVSPDIAACPDCLREMWDPADRRFEYPFTNCTNCGPRYTIIRDIPYDRPRTTMAAFPMCGECAREYHDPGNRRFHAQPVACPSCGPSLSLVPASPGSQAMEPVRGDALVLATARRLLWEGKILAVRGLGGFHIACRAACDSAVGRLREAKRRSNKPFAVMFRDMEAVRRYTAPSPVEEAIVQSVRKPICLIPLRQDAPGLSALVAPGNRYLGVMLPYTPLHELLFREGLDALVMTSGNWSEEPIIADNDEALARLRPLVDAFVLHDRPIFMRVDDSVVREIRGEERVLRRARGFVPTPIDLGRPFPELLACGGELKHTFCLLKDRFAILSQHIGDLENLESMAFFQETLENLRRLYRVTPAALAHDLHPRYLSTQWAEGVGDLPRIGVQHHHAHVVSCMAENRLWGRVIGVAFDGTGYGDDGTVWGGEILLADRSSYVRAAHLRYVPLPGGEGAIREPWRMALSHLAGALGEALDLSTWAAWAGESAARNVVRLLSSPRLSPPTSSMGRLFDAASAILGIRYRISFEGEAAMDLEMRSDPRARGVLPFRVAGENPVVMDPSPMVAALWEGRLAGLSTGELGGRFHRTVAAMTVEACRRLRDREGLDRVCLSGGVFQNGLLLHLTLEALEAAGFQPFIHRHVPPNDGGLSLGQAVVAGCRLLGGLP